MADQNKWRASVIRYSFFATALLLIGQLLYLQVIDRTFRGQAEWAGVSQQTVYPARGLIYDRDSQLLVVNNPMYDLMLTYNQFYRHAKDGGFDTTKFCKLLGIDKAYFVENVNQDWPSGRFSRSVPFVFLSKISARQFAAFQESLYEFPGFSVQLRNARGYPHHTSAHVLGYIGEVNQRQIEDSLTADKEKIYSPGDYIGASGLERQYEYFLRGKKGLRQVLKDNLGREIGPYKGGDADIPPESGYDLFTTLDLELQAYGEELMQNKLGSIVAIEPSTGEILAMISAPTYDPSRLIIGQQRGKAFTDLLTDTLRPFLDRTVLAQYPPGSPFKTLVSLIGLQEGTLHPDRGVACFGGYFVGGAKTGCHGHASCRNVEQAIQYSCNTYFVTVFLELLNQYHEKGSPKKGLDRINEYLVKFGLGSPLGIDFPFEESGHIPTTGYYDKKFRNESYWRSVWIRSLSIGQGEYLMTNLQMANMAAAIANRGYWITPHLVEKLRDQHGRLIEPKQVKQRHETGINKEFYELVVNGMEKVVSGGTARASFIPDIPMCGKTGTAETNQGSGEDNSVFFAFAPMDNPKIAIAVYVENATWGGTYAAPIASLMIEKYIRGSILPQRKFLEDRMLNANLIPGVKQTASR